MNEKEKQQVREQIAGYRAHNELVLKECRERTPQQNYLRLLSAQKAFLHLGLAARRPDDEDYHLIWQKLREKWDERNKSVSRDVKSTN
jgi:hypothetical protein